MVAIFASIIAALMVVLVVAIVCLDRASRNDYES